MMDGGGEAFVFLLLFLAPPSFDAIGGFPVLREEVCLTWPPQCLLDGLAWANSTRAVTLAPLAGHSARRTHLDPETLSVADDPESSSFGSFAKKALEYSPSRRLMCISMRKPRHCRQKHCHSNVHIHELCFDAHMYFWIDSQHENEHKHSTSPNPSYVHASIFLHPGFSLSYRTISNLS